MPENEPKDCPAPPPVPPAPQEEGPDEEAGHGLEPPVSPAPPPPDETDRPE